MSSGFKKNVLVTGGSGFIGSNFLLDLVPRYSCWRFVNIDLLTYASCSDHLQVLSTLNNYVFVKGDITDKSLIERIFFEYKIDSVINFAAESHVDNSIMDPEKFVHTNIQGTFSLLEIARSVWLHKPHCLRSDFCNARFYQISTDEVYGSLEKQKSFTEESPHLPNSPYSATKSAADLLVRTYGKTYGLPILRSHCSNNYGPHQHDEKFIPTIIRNALYQKSIPIYGNGCNERDWLYISDHVRAIEVIFTRSHVGNIYNIGSGRGISNLDLARRVCYWLDKLIPLGTGFREQFLTFVEDRLGHDLRYVVNYNQLHQDLGWSPREDLETGLQKTIHWYSNQYTTESI